jgi:hypothetical protein
MYVTGPPCMKQGCHALFSLFSFVYDLWYTRIGISANQYLDRIYVINYHHIMLNLELRHPEKVGPRLWEEHHLL